MLPSFLPSSFSHFCMHEKKYILRKQSQLLFFPLSLPFFIFIYFNLF